MLRAGSRGGGEKPPPPAKFTKSGQRKTVFTRIASAARRRHQQPELSSCPPTEFNFPISPNVLFSSYTSLPIPSRLRASRDGPLRPRQKTQPVSRWIDFSRNDVRPFSVHPRVYTYYAIRLLRATCTRTYVNTRVPAFAYTCAGWFRIAVALQKK